MRVENSIRNFSYGVIGQIVNTALSFVCRTVFINKLNVDYLGISGLFTNILSVFSLAELGIGSAIIIYMYKPLAERDEYKLKQLSNFYAKAYRIIGTLVAILGVCLTPFLHFLIKDEPNVDYLNIIYLLFVANSAISYFFSYKRAIITADQKEFICTKNSTIFIAFQYIFQIAILYITKNYLLYLSIAVVTTLGSNIAISYQANKLFPFLTEPEQPKLDKHEKRIIFRNVIAMMSHKVGAVVQNSTTNILMSAFVGVYWVGIYSNYLLIINAINSFVIQLFGSMSASLGNLSETEDENRVYSIYKTLLFLAFWVYGFCSICFFVLFNPFIKTWIGEKYLLDQFTIGVIVTNYFLLGVSTVSKNYINISKLFWNTKLKPWLTVIINLSASIIFVKLFGFIGLFLGALLSVILTDFWIDPFVLFNNRFKDSLRSYFLSYLRQTIIIIFVGIITYFVCNIFEDIVVKILICGLMPNILLLSIHYKSVEFKYLFKTINTLKIRLK